MSTKEFVELFLPPIFWVLKNKYFNKNISKTESPSVKEIQYNYLREIIRRSYYALNNVDELSRDISETSLLSISSSSLEPYQYGSYYELQRYAGYQLCNIPPNSFSIQHGYIFELTGMMHQKKDITNLVWSSYIQQEMLKISNRKQIYAIGAPFFYAQSAFSNEFISKEKKRLGKNLLVFPMHSTHLWNVNYDKHSFLVTLKKLEKEFNSIRVCLYWKDVQRGFAKIYEEAGYECVCCGHLRDLLFLSRQKTLFEIADATISNGIGSYIGYSVFMNKPMWLVPNEFEIEDVTGNESKELYHILKDIDATARIRRAFENNEAFNITDEQRKIVDKYWGISDMKSPDELRMLIGKCNGL